MYSLIDELLIESNSPIGIETGVSESYYGRHGFDFSSNACLTWNNFGYYCYSFNEVMMSAESKWKNK